MNKGILFAVPGLVGILMLSGCLRLEREHPEKRFFLVEAVRADATRPSEFEDRILQIRRLDISPAFEAASFVYRTGESSWESDYYNAFFTSPDVMLTELTSRWIAASGLFGQVVSPSSLMRSDYLLEGHVVSLYGDYRPGRPPEAVIEIQVLLLRDLPKRPETIVQGNYRASEPVTGNAPGDLVAAWGRGMRSILGDIEKDFNGALSGTVDEP